MAHQSDMAAIKVTGLLAADICTDIVELYFESSRSSGGGEVTKVIPQNNGCFIVVFKEKAAQQRVLAQKDHVLEGCRLDVYPYTLTAADHEVEVSTENIAFASKPVEPKQKPALQEQPQHYQILDDNVVPKIETSETLVRGMKSHLEPHQVPMVVQKREMKINEEPETQKTNKVESTDPKLHMTPQPQGQPLAERQPMKSVIMKETCEIHDNHPEIIKKIITLIEENHVDVIFSIENNDRVVLQSNTTEKLAKAKCALLENLVKLSSEVLSYGPRVALVVTRPQGRNKLNETLGTLLDKVFIEITDGIKITALSKDTLESAKAVLSLAFNEKSITVTAAQHAHLSTPAWMDFCQKLEKDFLVKIEVNSHKGLAVIVEGFKSDVKKSADLLKDHLAKNVTVKITIPVEKPVSRFLKEFGMTKLTACTQSVSPGLPVVDLRCEDGQIQLSGLETPAKEAEIKVKRLIQSLFNHPITLIQSGIKRFLRSDAGSKELLYLEKKHDCVLEADDGRTAQSGTTTVPDENFVVVPDSGSSDSSSSDDSGEEADDGVVVKSKEEADNSPHEDQTHSGIKVEIAVGDVTTAQADCLVCSIAGNNRQVLKSCGAIANAFIRQSQQNGIDFEKEYQAIGPVNPGEVKSQLHKAFPNVTVLYACLESWKGPQPFKELLRSIFQTADNYAATSIAMPTLGCGQLKYPPAEVKYLIESESQKYAARNPESTLKVVYVLAYDEASKQQLFSGSTGSSRRPGTGRPQTGQRHPRSHQPHDQGSHQPHHQGSRPQQQVVAATPGPLPQASGHRGFFSFGSRPNSGHPDRSQGSRRDDRHHRSQRSGSRGDDQHGNRGERRKGKHFRKRREQWAPYVSKSHPNETKEQAKLIVVSFDSNFARTAEKELRAIIADRLVTNTVPDALLRSMDEATLKKIAAVGNRNVSIMIDQKHRLVSLRGEKSAMFAAKDAVEKILADFHEQIERDAKQIKKNEGARKYLRYKSDQVTKGMPHYWKHYKNKISRSFGKTLDRMEMVDVEQHTFDAVQKLIDHTWRDDVIGQGKDARNLNHRTMKLVKIHRIENPSLWDAYSRELSKHCLNAATHKRPVPIDKLPDKKKLLTYGLRTLDDLVIKEVNECFLFHGTGAEAITAIPRQGFDFRLSNRGLFGNGIYFAESPTKADQYADKRARTPGEKQMFLARVLLGHAYVSHGPANFQRPPCLTCKQDKCSNHGARFDSVIGGKRPDGTELLFREFIVYECKVCYPEYLLTYQRQ